MSRQKERIWLSLSEHDRNGLLKIAREWELRVSCIVRRLVVLVLQGKITLRDTCDESISQFGGGDCTFQVRFPVSEADRDKLTKIASDGGFDNLNQFLRKFTRALVAGVIPKEKLYN